LKPRGGEGEERKKEKGKLVMFFSQLLVSWTIKEKEKRGRRERKKNLYFLPSPELQIFNVYCCCPSLLEGRYRPGEEEGRKKIPNN